MKKAPKYFFYSIVTLLLYLYCYNFYHFHPEIQFVFLVPGIFLMLYSSFLTDIRAKDRAALRGK